MAAERLTSPFLGDAELLEALTALRLELASAGELPGEAHDALAVCLQRPEVSDVVLHEAQAILAEARGSGCFGPTHEALPSSSSGSQTIAPDRGPSCSGHIARASGCLGPAVHEPGCSGYIARASGCSGPAVHETLPSSSFTLPCSGHLLEDISLEEFRHGPECGVSVCSSGPGSDEGEYAMLEEPHTGKLSQRGSFGLSDVRAGDDELLVLEEADPLLVLEEADPKTTRAGNPSAAASAPHAWTPGRNCNGFVSRGHSLHEQGQVLVANTVERLMQFTRADAREVHARRSAGVVTLRSCSNRQLVVEFLRRCPPHRR